MGKLRDMLGEATKESPFLRGKNDAQNGKNAPAFPTPNSSWAEKLYFRGFQSYAKDS